MIAQTFTPAYFAQKSLAAALLGTTPRKIDAIEVVGAYALVFESGATYPVAIELAELETEHDRQRRDRGAALVVEPAPDGWDVTGGDEPHYVHSGGCDCHDWARQFEAGRPAPFCKHLAAVELLTGRPLVDAVLAAADESRAALGW